MTIIPSKLHYSAHVLLLNHQGLKTFLAHCLKKITLTKLSEVTKVEYNEHLYLFVQNKPVSVN